MLRLTACAAVLLACCATAQAAEPPHSAELDDMIVRQAKRNGVPEKLVRRIVMRESKYNPRARNHSFWGLMQISYPTAKSMGFKGSPSELLDPLVNLTYAVPYLANAFIIAGKQEDAAVRLYASGYYATAKSRNLLDTLRTASSDPVQPDEGFLTATARPVSNLITAVVEGPPLVQPAPVQQAAAGAEATPAGGPADIPAEVMMTAGKKGNEPPKTWTKDGGMTVIAKGEQRVEQVAAYVPPPGAEPLSKAAKALHARLAAHARSKKTVEFASLDVPPANAQAYASAGADQGNANLAQSAPQEAIAQATANPPAQGTIDPAPATVLPAEATTQIKKAAAKRTHVAAKKPKGESIALAKTDEPAAR